MVGKCKRRPYDGCASGYQWAGEACPREFMCVKQKYLDYRLKRKPYKRKKPYKDCKDYQVRYNGRCRGRKGGPLVLD